MVIQKISFDLNISKLMVSTAHVVYISKVI